MPKPTIYSIAEETGLSASTVSRAFARPEMVRPDVRERIFAVAERLGYETNRLARSLSTGRTGALGLLIPDLTNPFFPPLVRAIQQAAEALDSTVIVIDADSHAELETSLIARLTSQTDALVLASPRAADDELADAIREIPTVTINRTIAGCPAVVCDSSNGLREAGNHLRALGHQRIALARGPAASWAAAMRTDAIVSWAVEPDIELLDVGAFDASYEGGLAAGNAIVASDASAAFVFDDLTAYGVVAALAESGRFVPRDLSLVGCDDVLLSKVFTPSLTTVAAPIVEIGQAAVQLVGELLRGAPAVSQTLHGRFVERRSTGPR